MGLGQIFVKQGGFGLIKRYQKAGVLLTAVAEFLILGTDRTALELLSLSAEYKTRKKLEKKYKGELIKFDKNYNIDLPHESSDKVWICWFQGMKSAPELVQRCYESIKQNMPDKDIVVVTIENMGEYVTFPDFVMTKWKSGVITHTHMTDLLRLELLIKYGGLWLDATVLCTSSRIPDYYFNSDLFVYQCLKPGRDGQSHITSSWLMNAKTNNKILMATRHLCYKYWETHKSMVDYFLLHDFFAIALEYYPDDWKKIVPKDNATPHILLLRLFDQYDRNMYQKIIEQSPFHKLSYKFSEEQMKLEGTYYKKILGGGSK